MIARPPGIRWLRIRGPHEPSLRASGDDDVLHAPEWKAGLNLSERNKLGKITNNCVLYLTAVLLMGSVAIPQDNDMMILNGRVMDLRHEAPSNQRRNHGDSSR